MELTTERLQLRAVTLADVSAYSTYFLDYEVIRYLSSEVPWPYPENGVEEYLKNVVMPQQGKDRWVWGIFFKEKPEELIGCIDLWRKGKPEHRGFWLGRKFWGKGIMTEANFAVIDYAFNQLGFDKLVFANAVGNIGSRRVKEKTGCRWLEIRPASLVDPSFNEQELWELTHDDWIKFNRPNV